MRKKRQKKRFKPWLGGMRVVSKPNHFKRHPSEWSAKKTNEESRLKGEYRSGVQKVKCKGKVKKGKCRQGTEGWVQKGKCRQGTHDAPKHARWPATTCGSLTRIPPGQGLGLLRSPTSTKTEQKWNQNRPQMRPIWARGGKGQPKINENMKNIKNANVKKQNKKKRCFWNLVRFSQKSEGSTAGRLPRFFQQMW